MSNIPDSTDPMPAIQQAHKALESLQIKDAVDRINDSYQQLQNKIEKQREEEQRIEEGKVVYKVHTHTPLMAIYRITTGVGYAEATTGGSLKDA